MAPKTSWGSVAEEHAIVQKKRVEVLYRPMCLARGATAVFDFQGTEKVTYYVTFKTHNLQLIELAVPCDQYIDIEEGSSGILVRQGKQYIHFR